MSETNIKITVDLADKAAQKALGDFIGKADKADRSVKKLRDSGNGTFSEIALSIGKATGVYEIFQGNLAANLAEKAFNVATHAAKQMFLAITVNAEEVKRLNVQFNALAENAGVSGDALREAFLKAADGLVDDTDVIRSANNAMIELGEFATDLPKIFELAKKATVQFGGDVTENFETMVTAIASGNTKALKSFGLFINAQDSIDKFAKSLKVQADQLSETGKKQALYNALLEKGEQAYKTVDTSQLQATTALKRLKVAFAEAGETAGSFFNRLFGDTASKATNNFTDAIRDMTRVFKGAFGTDQEKAQVALENTAKRVKYLEVGLASLEKALKTGANGAATNAETQDYLKGRIAAVRAEIDKLKGSQEDADMRALKSAQAASVAAGKTKSDKEVLLALDNKIAEQRKAFAEQTLKDAQSSKSNAALELELAGSRYEIELADLQKSYADKLVLEDSYFAQKAAIQAARYTSEQEAATQRFLEENQSLAESRKQGDLTERQYYASRDYLAQKFAADQLKRDAAIKKSDAETVEAKKRNEKQKAQIVAQAFGDVSSLMQTGSTKLFEIGKVAAIAEATISGYLAVQNALARVPYPLNLAAAAGIAIKTGVNVANIQKQKLAFEEGGIVPGTSYIGDRVTANVNSGEMILNRQQQRNLFDMANGGGSRDELRALSASISALLQQPIVINIDGKEVIGVIRGQLNAGRSFT